MRVKGQGVAGLSKIGDTPLRGGVVTVLAKEEPRELRRSGVQEAALGQKITLFFGWCQFMLIP